MKGDVSQYMWWFVVLIVIVILIVALFYFYGYNLIREIIQKRLLGQ